MLDTLGRSYHVPKDPTGVINGTPRQLDVLQFIYRFPYAPTTYIAHHFQLVYHTKEICSELFAKGYVRKFLKSYNSGEYSAVYMPENCWALTAKGIAFLKQRRATELFIPQGKFSPHQLYSTLIGTSFAF